MRRRFAMVAFAAMTVVVGMSACTKVENGTGNPQPTKATQEGGISTDPADSKGPAPEIAGAKKGGTAYILRRNDFSHLDPSRQYSVTAMALGQLYYRTLTTFKEVGNNKLLLVGDLAEDAGKDVNKDCKTWEYKIKKGVKYEDGTEVKAGDIAYGVTRMFNDALVGGPTYMMEWLADSTQYTKVFDHAKPENKDKFAPGITVVDDYTVKFDFKKPHCEVPYAFNLPFGVPVPKAKDTGVNYDLAPVSTGPYKITKFTKGSEIVLERNTNWDANTDPVRHAYPDKFQVKLGIATATFTQRLIADVGDDQFAMASGMDPAQVAAVASNASLQSRVISEQTPFMLYLWINNQKVTDLKVRQALNWAVDRDSYIKSLGGDKLGSPGTTILSPLTIGYESYDAYPGGPNGNPTKAKELLGGATPTLVMAHPDDPDSQLQAVAIKTGLEKAGFKITLVATPADSFLDKIGEKNNPWDIYISGWAADWPSGASTLPVLWDGRTIKDANNQDYMYWNDDATNAEFDRINALPDSKAAAKAWAALDKKIMTDFAPCVPLTFDRDYYVYGSKVGGLFESDVLGTAAFVNVYLK